MKQRSAGVWSREKSSCIHEVCFNPLEETLHGKGYAGEQPQNSVLQASTKSISFLETCSHSEQYTCIALFYSSEQNVPGKAAKHRSLALCITLQLSDSCFSGGGGRSQAHPQGLFSVPESKSPTRAGRSPSRCKTDKENNLHRQKSRCVPALQIPYPKSLQAERGNGSESHLVFIRVIFPTGAFDPASWGSGRFKELRGIRKLPRSFCRGKAQQVWPCGTTEPMPGRGDGSVCPPALGTGALALFDKYVSCHFSLKVLRKLLLLRGSRGKHTQLLAPPPFLSTQGRVSALYLGEGNLQPQEEAEKNRVQLEVLPTNTVS